MVFSRWGRRPMRALLGIATITALAGAALIPAVAYAASGYSVTKPGKGLYTYSGGAWSTPFDDLADGVSGNKRGHLGPLVMKTASGSKITAFCIDMERGLAKSYSSSRKEITSVTTENNRKRISYIMWKWGNTANNTEAAAAQIAVWKYTNPGYFASGSSNVEAGSASARKLYGTVRNAPGFTSAKLSALKKTAAKIVKDANSNALKSAKVTVSFKQIPTLGGTTAILRAEVVGTLMSGRKSTLARNSFIGSAAVANATFADRSGTTDSGRKQTIRNGVDYKINLTSGLAKGKKVTGTATFSLPFTSKIRVLYSATSKNSKQRVALITAPSTSALTGSDAFAAPGGHPWEVAVSSKTTPSLMSTSGPISDDVTLGVAVTKANPKALWGTTITGGFAKVKITNTLYFSESKPAQQASVPSGSESVGEVSSTVSGPDNPKATSKHYVKVRTPAVPVTKPGYYTWVTAVSGAGTSAENKLFTSSRSAWGIPSETTFFTTQAAVTTTASAPTALLGEELYDTAHVVDPDRQIAELSFALYKIAADPSAGTDPVCDASTQVWQSTQRLAVAGSGDYESERFTPQQAGVYTYQETAFSSDGVQITQGKCGEPSETVVVTAPSQTPAPSTSEPEVSAEPSSTPEPSAVPTPSASHSTEPSAVTAEASHSQDPAAQALAETGIPATLWGVGLFVLACGVAVLAARSRRRR